MLWGRGRKCKALAERFAAAANARDVDAMRGLVTPDFTYIDSWREGVEGREIFLAAAQELFAADPEFRIEIETISFSDPYVLMRGWASSGIAEYGRRRAVWRARCDDGLLGEWQSWAEGAPPAMSRAYSPRSVADMSSRASEKPAAP